MARRGRDPTATPEACNQRGRIRRHQGGGGEEAAGQRGTATEQGAEATWQSREATGHGREATWRGGAPAGAYGRRDADVPGRNAEHAQNQAGRGSPGMPEKLV
ncbi:hypothetical protein DFH09DRAFT_1100066 [Mycena vulgaris]|nr:hypothetical protein DFH09DRAFT_1100066 [Mycena vulgaris]